MKDYEYKLGKSVLRCPQCGHKTFKPYVGQDGTPIDPQQCGRCNRENNCAYHVPPRVLFEMRGTVAPPRNRHRRQSPPPRPQYEAPSVVPAAMMERTLSHYRLNPLVRFLTTRFWPETVAVAVRDMLVGTSAKWGGATVFWYRDATGNLRTAKIMGYDPATGKRLKNPSRILWLHRDRELFGDDFKLGNCFFGAHRVNDDFHGRVLVVESEKTALILRCALLQAGVSGYEAIATGGCGNIGVDADQLKRNPFYKWHDMTFRRIVLLPDADMYDKWRGMDMTALRSDVRIVPPASMGLTGSDDIGDALLAGYDINELVQLIESQL